MQGYGSISMLVLAIVTRVIGVVAHLPIQMNVGLQILVLRGEYSMV